MPGFEPKPLTGRLGMLAQGASLLLTGVLIWNTAVRPQLLYLPLFDVVSRAILYAILAWVLSAGITLGLYLVLPGARHDRMLTTALRTASIGVWFAPACILLSSLSPATLAAALVLVVAATRVFYSEWVEAGPPPPEPVPTPILDLFGNFTARRPILTRELLTGVAAAVAFQSGVVSIWRHHPMLAGGWFVLGTSIITLFALISGAVEHSRPPVLPRSVVGMAMTVLLAAGLTVGGIRAARGHGSGEGDGSGDGDGPGVAGQKGAFSSAKDVLKNLFGDDEKQKGGGEKGGTVALKPPPPPAPFGIAQDGTFPGVILWPEVRAVTRIVAPPPQGISIGTAPARPYGIPFAGQYLLYRFPQRRPPPTSILQRGSPAALSFSTTDRTPLNMDAIQKLDEPIDLSCCRAIRIDIWNADRYPGTVTIQLFANDNLLGSKPVQSTPDLSRDPLVAVPETLEFPTQSVLCDELKVVFRRSYTRSDKSAKIAIERFVLVP